ncbi:MAG: hypothetical protein HQ519_18120 [Planctomycetes bacterium]|nr:hypothetical protein [Planctomycetota bacterium]
MHLVSLALILQVAAVDAAPTAAQTGASNVRVGNALEGSLALLLYALPVFLGVLAAVAPEKSKKFYPMLMPAFMACIFVALIFCGRLFLSGYLIAQGHTGDVQLSSLDFQRFTGSVLIPIAALWAAFAAALACAAAAYRGKGLIAALPWLALAAAVFLTKASVQSIVDIFAGTPGEDPLDATALASGQLEAWADRPTWVATCLALFLILHHYANLKEPQ